MFVEHKYQNHGNLPTLAHFVSGVITQPPAPISPAYNPVTNPIPSPYPPPYEASYSILQPQYVPHFSNNDIQLGSFILPQASDNENFHIFGLKLYFKRSNYAFYIQTGIKVLFGHVILSTKLSIHFQAFDSEPAHVPVSSLPQNPPHAVVSAVAPAAHASVRPPAVHPVTPLPLAGPPPPAAPAHFSHLPFSLPLVQPPEHHTDIAPRDPDPYLASEQELLGRSFDDPFWYPKHRHIIKGYRNKERGDKVDHRDKVK